MRSGTGKLIPQRVLECLSGMPFEVEFISFDDVRNGIPEEIKVIINVGDAYTAFSGAENWIDERS